MKNDERKVTLEAPGNGLPKIETWMLKVGFKLLCKLKSREYFTGEFANEADKINQLLESRLAAQFDQAVLIDRITGIEDSSRQWSVFMTLEHLAIVNEGVSGVIEALVANKGGIGEVRIEDVKPHEYAGAESVTQFNDEVKSTIARVSKLKDLKNSAKHYHPWFGEMDASQWHALLAVHMRIHRKQIEKILERV